MMYKITWSVKNVSRKLRYYANFRSYAIKESEEIEKSPRKSSNVDIRVTLPNPTEVIAIARMLGCNVSKEKKWVSTDNENAYFRLIVYAVVRRTLRKPAKIDLLKRLVLDKGFDTDAWWWANTFINKYRSEGIRKGIGIKSLYRPAKAFKLIYNLAEK